VCSCVLHKTIPILPGRRFGISLFRLFSPAPVNTRNNQSPTMRDRDKRERRGVNLDRSPSKHSSSPVFTEPLPGTWCFPSAYAIEGHLENCSPAQHILFFTPLPQPYHPIPFSFSFHETIHTLSYRRLPLPHTTILLRPHRSIYLVEKE
jgi:hypothetical protein